MLRKQNLESKKENERSMKRETDRDQGKKLLFAMLRANHLLEKEI